MTETQPDPSPTTHHPLHVTLTGLHQAVSGLLNAELLALPHPRTDLFGLSDLLERAAAHLARAADLTAALEPPAPPTRLVWQVQEQVNGNRGGPLVADHLTESQARRKAADLTANAPIGTCYVALGVPERLTEDYALNGPPAQVDEVSR